MSVVTGGVNDGYNRHHILREALNNPIRKTSGEAPPDTQTAVAQSVNQRIEQQSVNGVHDLARVSLPQTPLAFLILSGSFGDVRQCVRPDIQPI